MLMPERDYSALYDSTVTTYDTSYPCVLEQYFDPGLTGWYGTDGDVHLFYEDGAMGVRTYNSWMGPYVTFPTEPGQGYTIKLYMRWGSDYAMAMEAHDSVGTGLLNWQYIYSGGSMPIMNFTANEMLSGFKLSKVATHMFSDTIYIDSIFICANTPHIDTITKRVGSAAYRYGFNGQEKDDDILGIRGSLNTAEFWEYDARLGRRWNLDPVDYAISNYQAFFNNPIVVSDPDGDDPVKRFSFKERAKNFFLGNGYKNKINRWASEHNVDESDVFYDDENKVGAALYYKAVNNGARVNENNPSEIDGGVSLELHVHIEAPNASILRMPAKSLKGSFGTSDNQVGIEDFREENGNLVFNFDNYVFVRPQGGVAPSPGIGGKNPFKWKSYVESLKQLPQQFKNFKNLNALKHIFRNAPGHVVPNSLSTAERYARIFSKVMSNPNNLATSINPAKAQQGIQMFQQTFRNGKQVWVEVLNGKIINGGVNLIPRP